MDLDQLIALLLIGVATFVSGEIFVRAPIISLLRTVRSRYGKIARVFLSKKISEHWKEQAIPALCFRVAGSCLLIVVWISALACPFIVFSLVYLNFLSGQDSILADPTAWTVVSVVLMAYVLVRYRMVR